MPRAKNIKMLKTGTIEALFSNNRESPLFTSPIVQIFSLKKIDAKNDVSRFHVSISDSKFYMKGIFSSQVSKSINVNLNDIIKISDFLILEKNNVCFIYIKKAEIINSSERIGTPRNVTEILNQAKNQPNDMNKENEFKRLHTEKENNSLNSDNIGNTSNNIGNNVRNSLNNENIGNNNSKNFTPIAALNPFQAKWSIKGTVQKKSDLKNFKKSDGKFFTFQLIDSSGSIKVVAFTDASLIWFDKIEESAVIDISQSTIKMTNKQYNNCTSDYEVHLEKNSIINFLDELPIQKEIKYFKINEVLHSRTESSKKGEINILGVIHEIYPPSTVISKATQKELKKRDLILVDDTGSVRITLWNESADLDLEESSILSITDIRSKEYNGIVSISTSFSSIIKIDPENENSYTLKGWYDKNKENIKIEKPKRTENYCFLEEIQNIGTCIATVLFLREDNLFYKACADNCNKKVTETEDGYFCEKCNVTKKECSIRYLTTLHISDSTSQVWLNIFDDFGNSFFGLPAESLKKMGEENPTELQNFLKSLLYKEYVIKIKRIEEVYNGELKIKWRGLSVQKVDYLEESRRMLKLLEI